MAQRSKGTALRELLYGIKVDKATAVIPQTAYGALFTITVGRVIVTSLVGEVTIAADATATNIKLTATPTTGTAVDIATNVAITSKEIGCLLGVATYAGAMVCSNAGSTAIPANPFVVPIGTLGVTTSANNAVCSVKWSVTYIPLDEGAVLVSA